MTQDSDGIRVGVRQPSPDTDTAESCGRQSSADDEGKSRHGVELRSVPRNPHCLETRLTAARRLCRDRVSLAPLPKGADRLVPKSKSG